MSSYFCTVDRVHNTVKLPWELKSIIDTKIFQRLRNLKQLGVADCIYPSATHTRFEHSIGSCYLAGMLLDGLEDKDPDKTLQITREDRLCVQIAALCHDIGHGPFSHLFQTYIEKVRPDKEWKHEQASMQLVDLLSQDPNVKAALYFLSDTDWVFVKECINSDAKLSKISTEESWNNRVKGRPWKKAFLYDIVSNKMDGYDVDRFDYYMRDAIACRIDIPFGIITCARLMDNCCVLNDPETNRPRICYAEKLESLLEDAGNSRYHLHHRVYQHPAGKAIEFMTADIMELADKYLKFRNENGTVCCLSGCIDDMQAYIHTNDGILSMIEASTVPEMKPAQDLYDRVQKRDLYYCLGEARISTGRDEVWLLTNIKEAFCDQTGRRPESVMFNIKNLHSGLEGNPLFYDSKDLRDGSLRSVPKPSAAKNIRQTKFVVGFLRERIDKREHKKLVELFKTITNAKELEGPPKNDKVPREDDSKTPEPKKVGPRNSEEAKAVKRRLNNI